MDKDNPYKAPIDRRDRLGQSQCEDEPFRDLAYQAFLDSLYAHKNKKRRKLGRVNRLLSQKRLRALSPSHYQQIRREYLRGEYFTELDHELDALGLPRTEHDIPPLAEAANCFQRGAQIAYHIEDWALVAQLKYRESNVCLGVDPKQFRRAFEAVRDALHAWRKLPDRAITADIQFEFSLADALGLAAQMVAEDKVAVDALDRAALLFYRLDDRYDVDAKQHANDEIYLDWDWATIYVAQGLYRPAFRSALKTRRKGRDLLTPINKVRLQRFIAAILLFCAEEGQYEEYPSPRLLAAAATAIDEAFTLLKQCTDERGRALSLLADAKLLGLLGKPADERAARIVEAQSIAVKENDPVLFAQIDVAWGDEYAFQHREKRARECYQKAVDAMTKIGFLELARIAAGRLERLSRSPRPRRANDISPSSGMTPLPETRIALN